MKKAVTEPVQAIRSCNQLSFYHLLHQFMENSKKKNTTTNTVGQFSDLPKYGIDETEVQLTKQLSDTDNDIKKLPTESESEDSLCCKSTVHMLEMLPFQKKRSSKIRISQLLYELQFNEKWE